MQRLTEAYQDAHVVTLNEDSRYVIFSDCHRGDGSKSDEFLKNKNTYNAALDHYWREGFTYVEAGDGDELWEFDYQHIIRANRAVWERQLKFHGAGRLLRMWGNHDIALQDPDFVREHLSTAEHPDTWKTVTFFDGLVPVESVKFVWPDTSQEILLVHGHQGDLPNDQAWRFNRLMMRIFWKYMHRLGFHSPTSPVANAYKRHKVERNYVKWIRKNRLALICGHTHREKFPREGDLPYFNAGSCVYPTHITALEIVGDTIALVRWRVDPDEEGVLRVTRRVVAGPAPLSDFDIRG